MPIIIVSSTFHHIHDQDGSVTQPDCRGHLAGEVHVPGRVHQVDEELPALVQVEQRDGGGLHRDPALLLVRPGCQM